MKKIMFFRPLFYMGGTEIAILNLVKKLKDFDIYIGYSDETSDKNLLSKFEQYATVININNVKEFNVDIFVACSAHTHLIKSLDNIKREKNILWIHHLINLETSILSIEEEYRKLDYIISFIKTISNKLKQLFPNLTSKIHTVYNVIDENEIIESSKEQKELTLSNNLNLVTVSRVCKAKGFDRMLHLAKHLKESNIDFKWFIIVDNYYKHEFDEVFKNYSIYKDNFEWFGFLDNPHNIVKQCDYSVLLSDDETWGLVLTEAMILGVPCICTDFEVAYEQIEDGKNGIILSRDNIESYKDRIVDILSNKQNYKQEISKFKYDNNYILSKWNRLLNELFLEIISN